MKKESYNIKGLRWLVIGLVLLHGCSDDTVGPLANFKVQGEGYRPGYKFVLDASESVSQEDTEWLYYRWDLNGDHIWDDTDWLLSPKLTVLLPGNHWEQFVGLQVLDSYGNITELYKVVRANDFSFASSIGGEVIDGFWMKRITYNNIGVVWTVDNHQMKSAEGIHNNPINDYGSYFTWQKANDTLSSFMQLPSLSKWQDMIVHCGGMDLAGYNLPINVEHGIKLLYGGKYFEGNAYEIDECGYYWTSTEVDADKAYAIKITKGKDNIEIVTLPKREQLSVRLFHINPEQLNN